MKPPCLFFAILVGVTAYACSCFAADDQSPPPSGVEGFVFCPASTNDQPVPLYVGNCRKRQVGTLNCGEKVEVLSRDDDMLRISLGETGPRGQRRTNLVPASAISRQADKFVPFDDQSGVPARSPDCTQFLARENAPEGFVFCSGGKDSEPAYFSPCQSNAAGSVACGEDLRVLSRRGDMLQVTTPPHGLPRYMASSAVSQQSSKFVPFGDDSGVPDKGAPDCSRSGSTFGPGGGLSQRDVTPPRVIYQTNPEFTDEARRKKVQGVVVLSLTVGADGLPRDIKVEKGIGYGLDEKAVLSVSRWRFDPALKDGQPIDKEIKVEVQFRLY
jgi:TonB family protein